MRRRITYPRPYGRATVREGNLHLLENVSNLTEYLLDLFQSLRFRCGLDRVSMITDEYAVEENRRDLLHRGDIFQKSRAVQPDVPKPRSAQESWEQAT